MDGFDIGFLRDGLLFFLVVACSLCLHEWAHAWAADRLGDPTPHADGRVTLNPLAHVDLVGTILFPLLCIFVFPTFARIGLFLGWARPVTVNATHFRHPGRDDAITTFAGPCANLVVSLLAGLVGGIASRFNPMFVELVAIVVRVNAWLFVFNMLPLPPLDGGRILRYVIGMSWETFARISQWSMWILLAAFYLVPGFTRVLNGLIDLSAVPAGILFKLAAGW